MRQTFIGRTTVASPSHADPDSRFHMATANVVRFVHQARGHVLQLIGRRLKRSR